MVWSVVVGGVLGLVFFVWVQFAKHRIVIVVERKIAATPDVVFRAVSEIERFPEIQPDVVSVEFLGSQQEGKGTRFRETRRQGKHEMVTELEVTEFVENERIRMVTDSHGTVWDTIFAIRKIEGTTELEIAMEARPHKLKSKIMTRLLTGMFRKGMESYGDLLRDFCENAAER